MKNLMSLAAFIVLTTQLCLGQGEIDEQKRAFYRHERTFGVMLNTDGYGLSYREGRYIDFRNTNLYEIDFGILNHPRELKLQNPWYPSGSSFVFGKLNTPFYLRGGVGKQHELFNKEDLGGVAIRYFFTAGPGLALMKPIYYKVLYPASSTTFYIKEEKFEESIHHPYDIYSKASFFKGIKETRLVPGAYLKGGFNFEFSMNDRAVHTIEVGGVLNAYLKQIKIMATEDNKALFFSLFISYRMGLIIDPFDPKSNRIATIFIRNR